MAVNWDSVATKIVGAMAKLSLQATPIKLADGTVVSPKAMPYDFEADEVDGDQVKRGDARLLVAAGDSALTGRDLLDFETAIRVTTGGRDYGVVGASQVKPGATALIYILHLRV